MSIKLDSMLFEEKQGNQIFLQEKIEEYKIQIENLVKRGAETEELVELVLVVLFKQMQNKIGLKVLSEANLTLNDKLVKIQEILR